MPEGPEVKIITEQLAKKIENQYLWFFEKAIGSRYTHVNPDGTDELIKALPLKIIKIACKGKFIYWQLENDWSVWNTLGMTGSWSVIPRHTKFGEKEHPAILLGISEKPEKEYETWAVFSDVRHFGTIKFVKGKGELDKKLKSFGPDMLSAPPDVNTFYKIVTRQGKKSIAEVLMNQKYLSGVGNYIKAEALYRAEISPWRYCALLTIDDTAKLRQSIIDVMTESYNAQGATLATYKTVSGEEGSFASQLKVYGKLNDPYGNPITSEETLDKRTTWWVPAIQK